MAKKDDRASLISIWRTQVEKLLRLYLDDLLLISGGICLIAAAVLQWGVAAGLAVGGVGLILCSVLVAKSGRR